MPDLPRLPALVLMLLLSGCSAFPVLQQANDADMDRWVAAQRYGRAIDALEARGHGHPGPADRARLRQIRAAASAYDRDMAAEVVRRRARGDWQGASELLDSALDHYPQGKRLLETQRLLRSQQKERLQQLEANLLIAKAEWLQRSVPVRSEIARTDPDDLYAKWLATQSRLEQRETAQRLTDLGQSALRRQDLTLAARCLHLADQLHKSEDTTRALAQLARLQRRETQHDQRAQAMERAQKSQELIGKVRRAMGKDDLVKARRLMAQLGDIDADNPATTRLEQVLDTAINAKVDKLSSQGDRLYTRGRILEARDVWRSALELDPGNERLLSRVERAERVLEKLRELQGQDDANTDTSQ